MSKCLELLLCITFLRFPRVYNVTILNLHKTYGLIPVASRIVLDRSNTGIVGSNPARDMDSCRFYAVLCTYSPYCVLIPRLRSPTNMSKWIHGFRS